MNATNVVRLAFLILTFLHRLSFHSKSSALQYRYHSEMLAYAKVKKAIFVRLGDAGPELTGRQALALIDNYFEVNFTIINVLFSLDSV